MASRHPSVSLSGIGRARIIVDGDNQNSVEVNGGWQGSYNKSILILDQEAPENQGLGRAQPTPDPSQPQ